MLNMSHDLGASLFNTWTDEQRREEVEKLVSGFRNGVPVGILCKMAETISGSREKAREFLLDLMPLEERKATVAGASGSMRPILESFLL